MLIDSSAIPVDQELEADVCIVGAGPAGLTVAEELARAGVESLVVESGPIETTTDHAAPRSTSSVAEPDRGGEVVGHPYFRLERTRAAGFGGTSRLWPPDDALRCRRLDPLDLAARPEIGRDGWPFGISALASHYERAEQLLALPPDDDPRHWEEATGARRLPLPATQVETAMLRFAPVDLFRSRLDAIRDSQDVRVVAGATAVELVTDRAGRRVEAVRLATAPGRGVRIKARRVVLAGGAIENARLLLVSRRVDGPALGDRHGLVGRCFMEHLHTWSATLRPAPRVWPHVALYARQGSPNGDAMGLLTLPERVLRAEGLPNAGVFFDAVPAERTTPEAVALHDLHRTVSQPRWPPPPGTAARLARLVRQPRSSLAAARAWRRGGAPERMDLPRQIDLMVMSEQLPSPRSRVSLSSRRDRLGVPLPKLEWVVDGFDHDTVARTQHLVGDALERAGLGEVTGYADELHPPPLSGGGYHHLGTTRMDASPTRGVVGPDARVHELANLYVTGGSVFPTGGYVNPTLTIVALAVRLARHLAASDRPARVAAGAAWSGEPPGQ